MKPDASRHRLPIVSCGDNAHHIELSAQMMRAEAGLHSDQGRRHVGDEPAPGGNRRSLQEPAPSSSSIRPDGICRQDCSFAPTSPFSSCRQNPLNSIRSRTSGSSCATTGSRTVSSRLPVGLRCTGASKKATAIATLNRQRHLAPSCGGITPTAERTVGPARTFAELDALRRCSALNFSTRHCSLRPIPHIITTGKQRLARELPNKRRRTEFSVPYSGSAGAVGRHNKLQIEPCSARCHQAPTSVRAPQAAREARHSPNSTLGHSAKSRNGSARAQLGSVTQQRR
jgi:hypothetical protein